MKLKLVIFIALLALICGSASAQCVERIGGSFSNTTGIQVYSAAFPWPEAVSGAMSFWDTACGGAGGMEFPRFESYWSGSTRLTINYSVGHATAMNCGTQYCSAEYNYSTRTITVYQYYGDPQNFSTTTGISSDRMRDLLAHEFGHALGLLESTCDYGVMSRPVPVSPYVTPEECQDADDANYVPFEGTKNAGCTSLEDCRMSPIIVDLDRKGISLAGPDEGVWFDLDADGVLERTGWTTAGANEAFLCVDWNQNGVIDNGSELFGSAQADNGFDALKMLDHSYYGGISFGGDDNGVIDSHDAIWSRMRLWIDRNHDGVSQPDELSRPEDHGLTSIDLAYKSQHRLDRYGNLFRYASTATVHGEKVKAIDVYFEVKH